MSERFIDTPGELAELCEQLRGSEWLTLDTEFIRERSYYPQLCLIQVANAEVVACIDPLALDDLEPLLDVIFDPAITKVFHAGGQDLEILYYLREAVPQNLFDTQIAATLLGQGEQVGYGKLVQQMLDVELDKTQSRTDWSLRPLSEAQIRYAADDVRYLRDVYRQQREMLERLGRLSWLQDDFAALELSDRYRILPQQAWKRVKGARRLRGVQLKVLQDLAAWREERAVAADKPRKWILHDDVLLDLARQMPASMKQLERMRGITPAVLRHSGQILLQIIAQARQAPEAEWPRLPAIRHLSVEQDAITDLLMAVVRLAGERHDVSPATLAARKDLEKLVAGERDVDLLGGWRRQLAGEDVLAVLEGRTDFGVRDGRPVLLS